jgi:hypothetical protein
LFSLIIVIPAVALAISYFSLRWSEEEEAFAAEENSPPFAAGSNPVKTAAF